MPIHSYILKYFDEHPKARINGPHIDIPPIERRPNVFKIEEETIELNTHLIPFRIYTPEEKDFYSLLVFFHDGGFISKDLNALDVPCRMISSFSGYKVIAIDYQITSNHNFFQQCYDFTKWVIENIEKFNGSKDNVAICGTGLGATLATGIILNSIHTNEFQLAKQILYYPFIDLEDNINHSEYLSRKMYNGKYGIDVNNLKHFSPLQNPLKVDKQSLSKIPNTLIFTAEFDPLCDEGELYAEKLREASVDVKLVRFDGNIHGFMQNFPGSPDYMRGYEITAEFLNS